MTREQVSALLRLTWSLSFYPLAFAGLIWAFITQQPWFVPVGIVGLILIFDRLWFILLRELWRKAKKKWH